MTKGSNGLTGEYMFRQLTSTTGKYQLTTERLMSQFYRGSMGSSTDGTFKAVCLSGIRTEANTGDGPDANDANIEGAFIKIVVRPLTPFGDILPDPRLSTDPKEINAAISTHQAMWTAKSDFGFKDQSAISFGQVINCYFEDGSIANSDFSGLRFSEPQGLIFDQSFEELSTIEGVITGMTAFEAGLASLLGSQQEYKGSLLKEVDWGGKPKKLMVGSIGVSPKGYWAKFRKDLQAHITANYPELGFRIGNLGVIRPLAAAANASNPDRANGSKHGAGLAQDLYLHTETYGEYKSYKKWNPILAKDIKLVRLMRGFAADRPEIQWGGNFGGGSGDIVKGRGITEFHHYEFKNSVMPKYFKPYDAEIKKATGGDLSAADLTSTKVLAKLYKALMA